MWYNVSIKNSTGVNTAMAEFTSEAFDKLFADHYEKLYRLCLVKTRNTHDSEQITLLVFEMLWENRHKLPDRPDWGGWLYKTTENKHLLKCHLLHEATLTPVPTKLQPPPSHPHPASFPQLNIFNTKYISSWASQVVLVVKNPPADAGDVRDTGSIPGLGRFPRRRA